MSFIDYFIPNFDMGAIKTIVTVAVAVLLVWFGGKIPVIGKVIQMAGSVLGVFALGVWIISSFLADIVDSYNAKAVLIAIAFVLGVAAVLFYNPGGKKRGV